MASELLTSPILTAQTMVASSVTIGRPYALRTQSRMTPLAPDEIIERFNPVTVWLTVKRPFECDPIEVQIDKSDILDCDLVAGIGSPKIDVGQRCLLSTPSPI